MFIEKRKKSIQDHVLKGLLIVFLHGHTQNYPVVSDIKPYWLNWLNSNLNLHIQVAIGFLKPPLATVGVMFTVHKLAPLYPLFFYPRVWN